MATRSTVSPPVQEEEYVRWEGKQVVIEIIEPGGEHRKLYFTREEAATIGREIAKVSC